MFKVLDYIFLRPLRQIKENVKEIRENHRRIMELLKEIKEEKKRED